MYTFIALILRIFSNSAANLYQKKSTELSQPLIVNLHSYMIMSGVCIYPALCVDWSIYGADFWIYTAAAGLLCTIGTIALIEALRIGDMSTLAPINSYKSVIGIISAAILLKEMPDLRELVCIALIIAGSYFVLDTPEEKFSLKLFWRKDIRLRFFALFCSGTEAAILKKIILLSSYKISLILWCFSGFICTAVLCLLFKNKINGYNLPEENKKNCFMIAGMLIIMQLTTNYVFLKINVGTALALFQLSSLVSLYFGYKIFNEKHIIKKLFGTLIMICSAAVILLK